MNPQFVITWMSSDKHLLVWEIIFGTTFSSTLLSCKNHHIVRIHNEQTWWCSKEFSIDGHVKTLTNLPLLFFLLLLFLWKKKQRSNKIKGEKKRLWTEYVIIHGVFFFSRMYVLLFPFNYSEKNYENRYQANYVMSMKKWTW